MALMSGKVYSNTGAPSNADGVDGDIYLRLDGMKTTYRKESGAWVAVGSTLGAIPEFISGVGAPNNALGVDEQYYRDTNNQDIYYKQGGVWNLVGSLAAASLKAILDQAGIGKDLATAPNLINSGSLNAVTTVGEYYYNTAVADTPAPYGLMKVWREASNIIYQLVQASGNAGKLYNRYTTDGGATWGPWIEYANVGGNAGQRFKVAAALNSDEAVRLDQLTAQGISGLFASNHTIYNVGTHLRTLPAGGVIRVILVAGGGGGAGIAASDYSGSSGGSDGEDSFIYPAGVPSSFYLKAKAGKGAAGFNTSNGGNAVYGPMGGVGEIETNNITNVVILTYERGLISTNPVVPAQINHPVIKSLSLTQAGQGGLGGSSGWGIAGIGGGGAIVEGLIINKTSTALDVQITVGQGGAHSVGNASNGQDGRDGVCVVFHD
jgi:hypothetical protein